MSLSPKKHPVITFTLSIALSFSICISSQVEELQESNINPIMLQLSNSIIGIQKALTRSDREALIPYINIMVSATNEIDILEPQINKNLMDIFDNYRKDIKQLASDLKSTVKSKSLKQVHLVVKEIRKTCISCHVIFREFTSDYDLFPSIGNIITGKVKIIKYDGKARSDLSDVVVFIDRVYNQKTQVITRDYPSVSQKDRKFDPRVLPILKGTTVEFPNDDLIFHNVFSLSKCKPFDLDVYPPGTSKYVTFDKTGWVKVYCNIHPQMVSHIIVLDNSYFSITNRSGLFVIPDVPDGEYTLRVWYEFGSDIHREIQLSGPSLFNTSFLINEDKKFIQHRNKFGKPYRGKYK